uniref:Uncharacterized protein n=1 Tax=Cairina moschata TaxID=8855 RepID=A0A8C3BMK2_CAIMO
STSVGTTLLGTSHPATSPPLSQGNTTAHTPPPSLDPSPSGSPKAAAPPNPAVAPGSPTATPAPTTAVPQTTATAAEANTSPSGSTAPNLSSSGHPELVPAPTSPAEHTESPAPSTAPAPGPSNASATGPSTAPATGPSTAPATGPSTAPATSLSNAPTPGPSTGVTGCPFHPAEHPPTKPNPGLVVIICLFVAVLVGAAALLLVRLCRCRTPGFQRLDEVERAARHARRL